MQRGRRREMREERLEAIDRFEPQEFGDLRDAARARLRQARRQRVAALVQEPVDVAQQARQGGRGAGIQHRGDVALVEDDAVVGAALDHAGDAETGVRRGDVRLLQELKPEAADLDQRRPVERRVAVLDLELAGDVAGQAVGPGAAEIRFVHARPTHRQGQGHERRRARWPERPEAAAAGRGPGNRTGCRPGARRARCATPACRARAATRRRRSPGIRIRADAARASAARAAPPDAGRAAGNAGAGGTSPRTR